MTATDEVGARTARTSSSSAFPVRFRDLGPLLVEQDGRARPVGGARLEAALALLLIHTGRRVGLDALAEAMWGADGGLRSASTLDSHVFRLRQALEPGRRPGQASTTLVRDTGGYRLVAVADQVDSLRFARLATDAADLLATGSPDRALRRTDDALALWRGRPYGDAAGAPWAAAATARLEELHAQLDETHIGALLVTGAPERALVALETALAGNPLRERLWAHRMIALRDCGRRADALRSYDRARHVLVEELGIEPGPELRAVHAELLDDRPTTPTASGPVPVPRQAPGPATAQLPSPRYRLVGRDRDLAELSDLLTTHPLVTLTGPAGCGKTRLAVALARRVATGFADGVWFVDLTAATPERVLDTVSSAVELPVPVTGGSLEALGGFTRDRRMLLVLDNCEHVLDAVAELVEELLVDGSESAVLATSREPLDIAGEQVHALRPLATGDDSPAVELFLERLEEQTPGRSGDREVRTRASEIATAVDGLPLALELAAGRARAYSLPEIAVQVRADASSLSRIGRGRASHHATVRGAVDTSYRTLPGPEAALHRAAGAVPGPFTAELATALDGTSPAVAAATVAGLVHRSLLTPLGPARPGGPSRFTQLATVRGHALHVARSLSEDIHRARDLWIEPLVRARPPFGSHRQARWCRALDDDLAALRATLQHTLVDAPSSLGIALCARTGTYWAFGGMAVEGLAWASTALAACEDDGDLGTPADRALVRIGVGALMTVQHRPDAGRAQLRVAIEEARGATGPDAALLCADLAIATGPVFTTGDTPLVREMAAAAREIAAGAPELDVAVRHAEIVAPVLDAAAHPDLLPRLVALHADARACDNLYTAWIAAAGAVQVLLGRGRPAEALGWAVAAIDDVVDLGQRENPFATEALACALALAGDHGNAVRVFGLAEAHHARSGIPWPSSPGVADLADASAGAIGRTEAERVRSEGTRLTLADLAGLARV